ncbi:hypothetical protein ACQPZQ_08770 [Pseudonocardia sp. CA-142604]|uniref:hypothetical protein n=1 Tax=Pseudonocardia sp. CA-142604 TaxID=3240024 RepID=UPI003D92B7F6
MAVYRTQDHKNDDSDNGNTRVSQHGDRNRSTSRSHNRITNINILGRLGHR